MTISLGNGLTVGVPRGLSATPADLRLFIERVCKPARASSRLMFALTVALAAPAWRALGRRPACFHLYGLPHEQVSLAALAASLYGRLELTQWAALADEPKQTAVTASDGLMVLVEDDRPHRLRMLNAIAALWGKSPGFLGSMRVPIPSRTDALTLSIGDTLIDQTLVFVAAPPGLRDGLWLVNIPSDAGRGHGIFDEPQPAGYSATIAVTLMQLRGAVGLHWLEMLNGDWAEVAPALGARMPGDGVEPSGAVDVFNQVATDDLARGFRTIARVGELATLWGMTGWQPGEAGRAVVACERAWQAANAARIDVACGRAVR